ncbi:MAG: hypothetical protein HQ530_03635 [Parcubacteria group bacterium]|nr:hypothetical protein [Parcubacteria group bacterium]
MRVKIDVEAAQTSVAESLRRAETLARASQGDSAWGVYVQSSGLTIFKGSNYAGRDLAADEITEFAERVSVAQNYEVVFTKMVAEPQWTGTISLSAGGITRSVDVGVKGVIQK